jgi:tetratricopeptide (TPR) repeat protein
MQWGGSAVVMVLLAGGAGAADLGALQRLLEQGRCEGCRLQDADLVHAQLRGARLRGAQLQRANLGRAVLTGADLRGADLRQAVLQGADLAGADLRGAQLEGADLRGADLQGARLEEGALERSHWEGAQGVSGRMGSWADLHNAGVAESQKGRWPEAEARFDEAITRQPQAAISWLARGLSRGEQGRTRESAQDLAEAGRLYRAAGEIELANQLEQASRTLLTPPRAAGGNGWGSALLGGAAGLVQQLAPYALKLVGRGLF